MDKAAKTGAGGLYGLICRPLLFNMDAEDAHGLMYRVAPLAGPAAALLRGRLTYQHPLLETTLAGTRLKNPLGLAAGFDKNGRLTGVLGQIGFGFEEVGSITGQACPGNPRPRIFRMPEDAALVNRMGLNGDGAEAVAERLAKCRHSLPIGVNIAKSNLADVVGEKAVEDLVESFRQIRELPLAYITINASCPNTHDGMTRETRELEQTFEQMRALNERKTPLFLKLSPDSSDELIDDLVSLAKRFDFAGFVCGNTTLSREGLRTSKAQVDQIGFGGLSGPPLFEKAVQLCAKVYKRKAGNQQIIGCGGIACGADAYRFLKAGASCIQIYTALIYHGPELPARINRELVKLLERDGTTLERVVGVDGTGAVAV